MDDLKIFTGTAHPELAAAVCGYLGAPAGKVDVFQFSNENIFVQFKENIRSKDVFIIQPFSSPVNQNIMEFLIMIDAAKRASAGRITAVIPYYSYGRTDKKDQPRVPITARLLADLITVAGANRVLTIDLHAGQIQGFFNIPVDELTALPLLAHYFQDRGVASSVVVATDVGITKTARDLATRLQVPLAIIEKRRIGNQDQAESLTVIGDVGGKCAILVDDEVDTGGTIVAALEALAREGATEAFASCTHALLNGPAVDRLKNSPLKELVVTDTVPISESKLGGLNVTVLSIAPLLGEAIQRIHEGQSVGAMFDEL